MFTAAIKVSTFLSFSFKLIQTFSLPILQFRKITALNVIQNVIHMFNTKLGQLKIKHGCPHKIILHALLSCINERVESKTTPLYMIFYLSKSYLCPPKLRLIF